MIKHVYIHIPFCKYICAYCDFCKKYIKYQNPAKYLLCLEKEIEKNYIDKSPLISLYIGGGTPSALTVEQVKKLGEIINSNFSFEKEYEFSFECNPDDITNELLKALKIIGVNRICIGMQTTNDKLLHELKRKHTLKDSQNSLLLAQEYFDNISVDFIFNLPNQTFRDVDDTLEFIKENKMIKNVSYYSLILEKNTILDTMKYQLLSETLEATWYYHIVDSLESIGYKQYEISNFSKNCESIHNKSYWQGKQYYGFGVGASGYINNMRYTNTSSMKDYYMNTDVCVQREFLEKSDLEYEKIFLNLRTSHGIEQSFLDNLNVEYSLTDFDLLDGMLSIKKDKLFISSEIIVNILSQL